MNNVNANKLYIISGIIYDAAANGQSLPLCMTFLPTDNLLYCSCQLRISYILYDIANCQLTISYIMYDVAANCDNRVISLPEQHEPLSNIKSIKKIREIREGKPW
jgi:hypothetical protein